MGVSASLTLDWTEEGADALSVVIDLVLYPGSTFSTCYLFTDRCYLFLISPVPIEFEFDSASATLSPICSALLASSATS